MKKFLVICLLLAIALTAVESKRRRRRHRRREGGNENDAAGKKDGSQVEGENKDDSKCNVAPSVEQAKLKTKATCEADGDNKGSWVGDDKGECCGIEASKENVEGDKRRRNRKSALARRKRIDDPVAQGLCSDVEGDKKDIAVPTDAAEIEGKKCDIAEHKVHSYKDDQGEVKFCCQKEGGKRRRRRRRRAYRLK